MKISEATARDIRAIHPSQEDYRAAVDYLYSIGWKFEAQPTPNKPPYSWGWWVNADHTAKCRPCGDPGDFHLKAWDTLKLYVAVTQ